MTCTCLRVYCAVFLRGSDWGRPMLWSGQVSRRSGQCKRRSRSVGVQQRWLRRPHVSTESSVWADCDSKHSGARLQFTHHQHLRRSASRTARHTADHAQRTTAVLAMPLIQRRHNDIDMIWYLICSKTHHVKQNMSKYSELDRLGSRRALIAA